MLIRRTVDGVTEERAVDFSELFSTGGDVTYSHQTEAGQAVTSETALMVAPVFACIRILTDAVSTLPLDSMIRRDGIPRAYRPRPTFLEFNTIQQNKIDVIGQIMTSLLLDGNAYILTPRLNGEVQYLEVLDPRNVHPERAPGNPTEVQFRFSNPHTGESGVLDQYAIHHITGMRSPGEICGMSPISYARETIGLSLAADAYGARFYGNGARPGMIATLDPSVPYEREAVKAVVDDINRRHRGANNAHKVMALTQGMKLEHLAMKHTDAEYLATRKFQAPQIAMIFGVPVHLLGMGESNQFGTSIEQQNIAFAQLSLRPWVERIEAGLSDIMRLELGSDPAAYVSLNMTSYQRGDHTSWVESNMKEVTQGALTINEHRAQFGRPPVPWGDEPQSVQVQDQTPAEAHAEILAAEPDMPQIEGAESK